MVVISGMLIAVIVGVRQADTHTAVRAGALNIVCADADKEIALHAGSDQRIALLIPGQLHIHRSTGIDTHTGLHHRGVIQCRII